MADAVSDSMATAATDMLASDAAKDLLDAQEEYARAHRPAWSVETHVDADGNSRITVHRAFDMTLAQARALADMLDAAADLVDRERPREMWNQQSAVTPVPAYSPPPPAAVEDPPSRLKDMPNPTSFMLVSPTWSAIYDTIKSWDVNVPEYYTGYCGANGSHATLIYNAIQAARKNNQIKDNNPWT